MWSKARLTVYLVALLGGAGVIMQAMGLAVYDAAAGTIDPGPININVLAAGIATLVAPAVAAIANWRKW